ncbi:MAG: hypothetical protein ACK4XJ_05320 [Fimbriimonadaceae bacterium]
MTRLAVALMTLSLCAWLGAQSRPQVAFRAISGGKPGQYTVRGSVPILSGSGTFFQAATAQVAEEAASVMRRLESSGRGAYRLHPTVSIAEANLIAVQFEMFQGEGEAEKLVDVGAIQLVPQPGGAKRLELADLFLEGIDPDAVLTPVVATSLLRRDPDRPPFDQPRLAWLITRSGLALYARSPSSSTPELIKVEGRWLLAGLRRGPVEALWRNAADNIEYEVTVKRASPNDRTRVTLLQVVVLGTGVSGGLPTVVSQTEIASGELPATIRVSAPKGAKTLIAVGLAGSDGRWSLIGRIDPDRSKVMELRPIEGG